MLPAVMQGFARVDVGEYFYYPSVVTVTVGTTVGWKQVGELAHDVTAVDRTWGVALVPRAGYFEQVFSREGVYDYLCQLHAPGMRGTVVVVRTP